MDLEATHTNSLLEINHLSLEELEQLQAQVEARITSKREQQQADALAEIRVLVSAAGLTTDLVAKELGLKRGRSRKGGKVPPKYRDPENPTNLWSGRGPRPPKWLVRYEERGGKREDCLITKATAGVTP